MSELVPVTFDWQASAANDTSWRGLSRQWIVSTTPDLAQTLGATKVQAVYWEERAAMEPTPAVFVEWWGGECADGLSPTLQTNPTGTAAMLTYLTDQSDATGVEEYDMDELTLWPAEAPARTSVWRDAVMDWVESGAACSGTSAVSLLTSVPVGFSGRTSLALCRPTAVTTSPPCCGGSLERGPTCPRTGGDPRECASVPTAPLSGGCLTLDGSEWPSDAVVCSLSQVLEPSVDPKYCLSPRAAAGILERAQRRGRPLPVRLQAALTKIVETSSSEA